MTISLPIIFRPNTESYATDKFLCKIIKLLNIGKTNYWELNIYHENGKPIKFINEIAIEERMIFATFSSSFYRKQRLLEMFASSNIETYNDPIRYKRKSLKRRNKTEHSKATSDLIRNRDFASEKLHKNNHDIELEISREQAHNLLKIADSANKEERKQNLKGRNIELLSKIRTGSSAFSAIP